MASSPYRQRQSLGKEEGKSCSPSRNRAAWFAAKALLVPPIGKQKNKHPPQKKKNPCFPIVMQHGARLQQMLNSGSAGPQRSSGIRHHLCQNKSAARPAPTPGEGLPAVTGGNLFTRSFPKTQGLHRGLKPPDRCGIQEKYRRRILGTQLKPLPAGQRPRLGPPGGRDADPSVTRIPPAALRLWGDELSLPKHAPTPRGWLVPDIHP